MKPPVPPSRREGFTLADLLAVVAILGVLFALLGPTFSAVRAYSAKARCASNLRQIGAGLALYVQDHGVYPYHISGNTRWCDGSADPASFFAGPYLGSVPRAARWANGAPPSAKGSLFDCPAMEAADKEGLGPEAWTSDFFDYGQNFSLCGRPPAGIRSPERTVAIVEGGHYGRIKAERTKGLTYTPAETMNPGGTAWNTVPSILRYPHGEKGNFLFLDGHVSQLAPHELNENLFFLR